MFLSTPILQFHSNVSLHIDFSFVNKTLFLHEKSKSIDFLIIQAFRNRATTQIIAGLKQVIHVHKSRGFKVQRLFGNNEFNIRLLIESLHPLSVQVYGRNEHVGIA